MLPRTHRPHGRPNLGNSVKDAWTDLCIESRGGKVKRENLKELPAWIQKTGDKEAAALMQKMQEQLKAKNFVEVEKTADSILKLMGEKP